MRVFLIAVLAAAALAACDIPANAKSTRGTVAYDERTRDFWVDGRPYILPPDVSDHNVMNGDIVTVFWDQEGDARVVNRIEIEERFIFRFP